MDASDLALVRAIHELHSLSAAAEQLGMAAPLATKRLAAIEARLGHRLFLRTTRRVTPTAEGDIVHAHATRLLDGFRALEEELAERQAELAGDINLASTFGFGRLWLGPAVARFQQQHPRLNVQLQLTEQLPELSTQRLDGAVWLWTLQGPQAGHWTARRLARNQRVLVASPAYLEQHGSPGKPEDLARHACLVVRENGGASGQPFDLWHLQHTRDRSNTRVQVQGPLVSNSGELVRDWCLAGHGIMLRSLWDIAPALAHGALVRVLPAWSMPDADIQWLAPWRTQTPKRVRLLVSYLVEEFKDAPWRL